MSLRLGVGVGGVPEGPISIVLWSWVVPDKHHSIWTVVANGEEGARVCHFTSNYAIKFILGPDVTSVNLDVLAGQCLGKRLFGPCLLRGGSSSHPEDGQGEDASAKHDGEQNSQCRID